MRPSNLHSRRPFETILRPHQPMWKRVKQLFESLVYAGLKPRRSAASAAAKAKSASALHNWIDGKLNKAGPSDPLYLSNRTLGQKATVWAAFGVPALLVLAVVAFVVFRSHDADAPPARIPDSPSNAEIAAKTLPNLNNDLHLASQTALDIQDVHVVSGSPARLVGVVKNNSERQIAKAELVFDLTNKADSRLGAVSTEVTNIAPKASVTFSFVIEQSNATFALVREVHVQ
jgi:hypothetical protein